MKVSVSILSIKENINNCIKMLDETTTNYIHLDIMDGIFVSNQTWSLQQVSCLVSCLKTPLDVHLMVQDVEQYVEQFSSLNPAYITFHYEATNKVMEYISIIKNKGIGVGMSIKPNTDEKVLEEYLPYLDLILVMSVEPGAGGQKFMENSLSKIKWLKQEKEKNNYSYLIEVDGGINDKTISLVKQAGTDIVVSGSFVTNGDNYQEKIDYLKKS